MLISLKKCLTYLWGQEFNRALEEADTELDIIAAWLNFHVVNNNLQSKFEQLLQRGVTIKILYGIGDMSSDTMDGRNRRTLKVINHLENRFSRYKNFRTKCDNTHEKLFICDEKFYVNSSLNILSFDGEYSGDDVRGESGEASNNVALLREYRRSRFNF